MFNRHPLLPTPQLEINKFCPTDLNFWVCREADCIMMQTITEQATLELKTLVIAETIVPYTDKGLLLDYVKQQLDASNVLTDAQKQAVLTMVELAPMEASIHKEEIGEKGTLRNSAVLALITQHLSNIHFMLIG